MKKKIILLFGATLTCATSLPLVKTSCNNYLKVFGEINKEGYRFYYESCKCRDSGSTDRKYVINNYKNITMPLKWNAKDEEFVVGNIARKEYMEIIKSGMPVVEGRSTISFGLNKDEFQEKDIVTFIRDSETIKNNEIIKDNKPIENNKPFNNDKNKLPIPNTLRRQGSLIYPTQETSLIGHFTTGDTIAHFLNIYLRSTAIQDTLTKEFSLSYEIVANDCGPFQIITPRSDFITNLAIRWGLIEDDTYSRFFSIGLKPWIVSRSGKLDKEGGFRISTTANEISIRHDMPLEVLFSGERLISYSTSLYVPIR